jgi:hypothetical protein
MCILNVITENVITLSFCVPFVINLTKKPLLLILSHSYTVGIVLLKICWKQHNQKQKSVKRCGVLKTDVVFFRGIIPGSGIFFRERLYQIQLTPLTKTEIRKKVGRFKGLCSCFFRGIIPGSGIFFRDRLYQIQLAPFNEQPKIF